MLDELRLLSLLAPVLKKNRNLPLDTSFVGEDVSSVADQIAKQQDQPDQNQMSESEIQLRAMLGQMPVREKPNWGRRIMAGISGGAAGYADPAKGPEVAERIAFAPYYEKKQAWEDRLKPLKELADIETSRRTNERLISSSERTARIAQERQDLAERTLEQKRLDNEAERKIRQQRANTEQYRAEHTDSKFLEDVNGNIIAVDPGTNKVTPLLDAEGEPIQSIHLTPEQRKQMEITKSAQRIAEIGARTAGQKEVVAARGAEARTTQAEKFGFMEKIEKLRQEGRIQIRKTPTGNAVASTNRPNSPTQEQAARMNRVMEILSNYPYLDGYYGFDDKGNVRVLPSKDIPDVDPDNRMEALIKLEGSSTTVPSPMDIPLPTAKTPAATTASPAPATKTPTKRADGKTHVKRNGIPGWVTTPLPTDELIP